MTLLDVILLRSGWTPAQLGIEEPERDRQRRALSLRGVIDTQAGRVYSRESARMRERALKGRRTFAAGR